jgi:hypothetical protein
MGVKYSDTIERMRWAGKLKNDSAVARSLGVTPQALSNYKKRGELPTDLVLRFSNIFSLSMDWLIRGEGDIFRTGFEPSKDDLEIHPSHVITSTSRPNVSPLTPEHLICIDKLLKILDCSDNAVVEAIKHSIDSFYRSATVEIDKPGEEVKSAV